MDNNDTLYTYYAFISYKREDEKWAKWLQKKLESYGFPVTLRKDNPTLPPKIRPIFRDQSELSGGNLKEEIEKGLEGSKYLIVICSPRAAQSLWVSKEVQYFIDNGRENSIIPFIIGGCPNAKNLEEECFPEGLRQLSGEKEILGININEMGRDAAVIKVIARMFDLRFDTLWQRHEREKKRRNFFLISAIIGVAMVFVGVYLYIHEQKSITNNALSEQRIQRLYNSFLSCEKLYKDRNFQQSFQLSRDLLSSEFTIPDTLYSQFEYIIRMSYFALQSDTLKIIDKYKAHFPAMDLGDMPIVFNADGTKVYVGCNGFTEIEISSGKSLQRSDFWPSKFVISSNKIYSFDDYEITIYNLNNLNKEKEITLSTNYDDYQMVISPSANGEKLLTRGNTGVFNIYNSETGDLIKSFSNEYNSAAINYDGSIIALAKNDRLTLYSLSKDKELNDFNGLYASELQYDESGHWLILYLKDYNSVHVLNVDTKESYIIDDIGNYWGASFNFDGNAYGNKYIVSDDNRYIAIGPNIYDLHTEQLFKRLELCEEAMGLKIFPGAQKVVQINLNQEILIYSRKGKPIFDYVNVDFQEFLDKDCSYHNYDIRIDGKGNIFIRDNNGKVIGVLHDIDGDVYHVSVSQDGQYVLVSSQAIPTSLFKLSTGTLVMEFPFTTGDGDIGIGVFDKNGDIYFRTLSSVAKYKLPSIEYLLNYKSE